jgi:hypothetical protein
MVAMTVAYYDVQFPTLPVAKIDIMHEMAPVALLTIAFDIDVRGLSNAGDAQPIPLSTGAI